MAKNPYAGTKTEKNLQEALAGESMARNKYTYFASVAKKAGYEQIAALFQKTADNERITSGRTCMTAWQRMPMRKGSTSWRSSSEG